MAKTEIAPAVEAYVMELAKTAAAKKALDANIACGYESGLVRKLSALTDRIAFAASALEEAVAALHTVEDVVAESYAIRDTVLVKMSELRVACDEAETLYGKEILAIPYIRRFAVRRKISVRRKIKKKKGDFCDYRHTVGIFSGNSGLFHEPGLRFRRSRVCQSEKHGKHTLQKLYRLCGLVAGLPSFGMGPDVRRRQPADWYGKISGFWETRTCPRIMTRSRQTCRFGANSSSSLYSVVLPPQSSPARLQKE